MWQIKVVDKAELFAQSFGIRVPPRTAPKDQLAEEVYCLRRLLFPLAETGLLPFPLIITKSESPDFILNDGIGLEITKATKGDSDLTRFERDQDTKHYASDREAGTMTLSFGGWCNDVETEWVNYIAGSIRDKLESIDKYSTSRCGLVVYDNTPLAAPDLNRGVKMLRSQLSLGPMRSKSGKGFQVISSIREPRLIHDVTGQCRRLKYRPEFDAA
jgi:hypothetical protein